ncbi:hypothetical protein, variant [Blastomyces gilchristii SLH14081]|uniref:Uncharacterized protein n=1 Tax=Blastomyces gilchristii (strain SLH14081) TaxID=559298 RepID=A0A179UXB7_BLAGS|nr:uncharacterized protein BDBG_17573 [Blastomyces gilchristii SLH14081]XP_031580021.1 hypothetical protein, variant [Blastomyces gilchristii SLH14081]OAT11747.1 hypothetical protein BDBG_17573 [Blastomyces gilchristii SLH14081]OAT11748.1 hypothetical protein, variant [Blastomyces gilchristii SLH14081]
MLLDLVTAESTFGGTFMASNAPPYLEEKAFTRENRGFWNYTHKLHSTSARGAEISRNSEVSHS